MTIFHITRGRQIGSILDLYRALWRLLRGRHAQFSAAVGLLIGAQMILLSIPYFSSRALNALQLRGAAGIWEAAHWLCLTLITACASWLLHGPARLLERNAAITIRQRMSSELIKKLFELPLSWHEGHHSGATAHRVQLSTQALSSFAQSQFIYLNSAVRLIGPIVALYCLLPAVGLIAVAGFAIIILSVAGFDRAMLHLARDENDAERHYSAALVDSLGNTNTVYALRQARLIAARLEGKLLAVFVPLRRSIVLNEAKWFTVDLATRALNCILVGLFVWLTNLAAGSEGKRALLLGSLYMVWEYGQQASGVIASIASNFQTFARQNADYASAGVITDAIATTSLEPEDGPLQAWRRISFRDLSFRHQVSRNGRPAFEALQLSLERGKRYALIGASGSGKSTLLRLLAGLYSADRLSLSVDESPTSIAPAEASRFLRAGATLIPQDTEVYEGTLADNLNLCESVQGSRKANCVPDGRSPRNCNWAGALHAACATDFVEATPLGLETPIAERAANWSGGQRSRITLARGILAANGSALLLMDEPTASLDPETESRVYANIFDTFSDACIVSSIHRLDLLGRFDEVFILKDGQLVAQGQPDELALNCAEFRHLTTSLVGHSQYRSDQRRNQAVA